MLHWLMRGKRRRDREAEIAREIQAHLAEEADHRSDAGASREEARDAARRKFGSVALAAEDTRAAWGGLLLERLWHDVRFAVRVMRKSKAFTATAVVTLAIGIGANTAMLNLVNSILLQPLPYRDSARLVTVLHQGRAPMSPPDFLDLKTRSRSFESMSAACAWSATLTGGEHAEQVPGMRVAEGLFPLLGVEPLLGRTPAADEFRTGKENVLVLSHGIWQRMFGADPGIIGRKLTVNGAPTTVVGVMPAGFRFAPFWVTDAEVWAPLPLDQPDVSRRARFLRGFARLKPGVPLAQAQSEMNVLGSQLERSYPDSNAGMVVRVSSLRDVAVGSVEPALLVLLGAVGCVLLIACANLAGLALARSAERRREIAIRLSLGATRARVLRQLLTESVVIAATGGALGVLLAVWATDALRALTAAGTSGLIPRLAEVRTDPWVLAVAAALSLSAGLLFGLLPAIQSTRPDVNENLKQGGRTAAGTGPGSRLRNLLLGSEVALGLLLLTGAGLLLRSYVGLANVDPGFRPDNVLTMRLAIQGPEREAFYSQVIERVQALPGVESASMTNHLPIAGDAWGTRVHAEGSAIPQPGREIGAVWRVARPRYFHTMGIALLRGRDFTLTDDQRSPRVAIVNRILAATLWPGADPVGRRFTTGDPARPDWVTVVGLVDNVKQQNWIQDADHEVYFPFSQDEAFRSGAGVPTSSMTLVLRGTQDLAPLAGAVRQIVWSLNRDVPVAGVITMREAISNILWRDRMQLAVLGAFALFALILAAVGIYGVAAYGVARRSHEIALRMALGASRGNVMRMVLGQSAVVVLAGVACGSIAAFALGRYLQSLLYRVQPHDAVTFAGVAILLVSVALASAWLPARRAASVDPAGVLRGE